MSGPWPAARLLASAAVLLSCRGAAGAGRPAGPGGADLQAAQRLECDAFLRRFMPATDRGNLSEQYLSDTIDWALTARAEHAWAAAVPFDIFLNDVLPYARLTAPPPLFPSQAPSPRRYPHPGKPDQCILPTSGPRHVCFKWLWRKRLQGQRRMLSRGVAIDMAPRLTA